MLDLGECVRLRQVFVNLFLIGQIISECAMHLLRRKRRLAFHHALGRNPLAVKINQRVERDARSRTR
jgi:hypothetical protein